MTHAGLAIDVGRGALGFEQRAHGVRDVRGDAHHVWRNIRILLQRLEHVSQHLPTLGCSGRAGVSHFRILMVLPKNALIISPTPARDHTDGPRAQVTPGIAFTAASVPTRSFRNGLRVWRSFRPA